MLLSKIRERSLCLLNIENLDSTFQPWSTISDAKFHPDVSALYCNANINPIQSVQTDYLPPLISYLWPLVHHGANVWAVDHPTTRETMQIKFVLKYDLLIWDLFYHSTNIHPSINSDIVYPKVLILAPDWSTCENISKHLSNVHTDVLQQILMCCIYEGQTTENELYKKFLTQGCDLLIATPTIVYDLIEKRHIHFEQLQLIVYDQLDLLLHQTTKPIHEILNLLQLHTNKSKSTQHLFLSRIVNQQTKDFISEYFPSNLYYLSSSLMETYTYKNFFVYCEPCRNWAERKHIIQETLDLAYHCKKKVLMCAYQTRRLATMQSILNDLSIQSILIHSQLNEDEIKEYIHEWQTITDRPLVLLIQDDILNDIAIDNTDIIIHLDVQRIIWYQLYNQRMKLIYKHLLNDKLNFNKIKKLELTSLKSIEKFYQFNSLLNIPLIVILWPGDCAQVTYDFIDYINNSNSYLHPLIERLAKNNCYESLQAKINVEFCPTLKMFGECLNQKKLKRCAYRHYFHYDVDYIEQNQDEINEKNNLSNSFELYLPNQGEIELRITHVSDGNRLWANILRARNDINQTLIKIFDYDLFYQQVQDGFNHVKHRPLGEIVFGEIYFYSDENNRIHRVYVYDQEQTYFDIRRADSILNRLLKVSNTVITVENDQEIKQQSSSLTTVDRPTLIVFSLDTGMTITLKSNEHLYPIEPSSLKQYPPLATEIILCNIYPLDKITMTFTPFSIETLRSLTLNETFMGRIKLATRSCFWIDSLVKPVRLAALKRIAYDKPIRKQLILSKLVQSNDNHMNLLERIATEANLIDSSILKQEETKEKPESITKSNEQEVTEEKPESITKSNEQEITKEKPESITQSNEQEVTKEKPESITKSNEQVTKEEIVEDLSPVFKPFLNRIGQLIINPVGRSKEFFSKHNQQLHSDFVKFIPSAMNQILPKESSVSNNEQSITKIIDNTNRYLPLGRGHRINTESSVTETILNRPQSIPVTNAAIFHHSEERSPFQTLENLQQFAIDSAVTTPSEIGPNKMTEIETKNEEQEEDDDEIFEDSVDTIPNIEASIPLPTVPSESKQETTADVNNEDDQMMFIFGPKLFSQLRQIKDMEDEQRRQSDFPVQRNRNRHMRNNNPKINTQDDHNEETNETNDKQIHAPNMSRYEPFVGERGPLTQEQINYKQTQRKTRLFWEQTSRDIYLTIGFYNVDSTQTRVEFEKDFIFCRTKIRTYDRFVRIHLAYEILPDKCLFQVRRSNILLTIRKANEGFMWTTLTNRPIEPRPDFFTIDYGSDNESDTEKRRRTVNRQWEQIRQDKSKLKLNNDNDKFVIDDIDDDDHAQQQPPTEKLNNIDDDDEGKNQQELTDTSSDCHSSDSDDCYYEDQVPANHIPKGYDEADYDHRFYGQQIRS